MKPKVYTTYKLQDEVRELLTEHCEVTEWKGEGRTPREVLLKEIGDVEGLLTGGPSMVGRVDEELLSHAPRLKVVSNVSVGYNNFDLEALEKRDVIGTNTPYVLDETVADLAFGLILSTARRIVELGRFMQEGNWKLSSKYHDVYGQDVYGSTLGIIGMGRIGEAIARRAKFGFGMDILYHNRNRKPVAEQKYGAAYRDLDTLLAESDFVVLMTPLTPKTFHLIGEAEFKKMKDSAIFINVSRGQTVDEEAMIRALQNGELYGAGLDVFEQEPIDPENPLLRMPNVVVTPHIGSATAKTEYEMARRAVNNLVAVLKGQQPIDPVGK